MKKRVVLEVIGGQNLFPKSMGNVYTMKETKVDGVVDIKKEKYYFLGFDNTLSHERSVGKAATGAIVGGVLTGGIGAVAGAAIGGKKKDTSTAQLTFVDYETEQKFTIQIKCDKNLRNQLSGFKVSNLIKD